MVVLMGLLVSLVLVDFLVSVVYSSHSFNTSSWQILNALERLGYRVVTSSGVVTGFGKHDTK